MFLLVCSLLNIACFYLLQLDSMCAFPFQAFCASPNCVHHNFTHAIVLIKERLELLPDIYYQYSNNRKLLFINIESMFSMFSVYIVIFTKLSMGQYHEYSFSLIAYKVVCKPNDTVQRIISSKLITSDAQGWLRQQQQEEKNKRRKKKGI